LKRYCSLLALCIIGCAFDPSASAHPLPPRADLDGFVRRASIVLRGTVKAGTHPRDAAAGPFPAVTEVEIEKLLKGQGMSGVVRILGRDDHAMRYEAGQRGIFFLDGRPGLEEIYPTDQLQGEALFVRPGDEGSWDAYLSAVTQALSHGEDLWADAGYRSAVRTALTAPATALRAHAFRQIAGRLQSPQFEKEDLAAVLAAFRNRSLPAPHRLLLLQSALRYLSPSEVGALASDPGEAPEVRKGLFRVWAERAHAIGNASEGQAARAGLAAALADGDPGVRLHAAVALATLADRAGLATLVESVRGAEAPLAAQGLALLARGGSADAHRALAAARKDAAGAPLGRLLDGLLGPLGPVPPPDRTALFIAAAGGGVLLLFAVWMWRRRRAKAATTRRGEA
jgi:hypothetical protein